MSGRRSLALKSLVKMVATSPAFRRRCEMTSIEAKDRIFYPYVIDPNQELLPRAVVEFGSLRWQKDAGGDQNYLLPSGAFNLWLYDRTDNSDPRQAILDFSDFVDDVLTDLADLAGEDDNLAIVAMVETSPPLLSSPVNNAAATQAGVLAPYCRAAYRVEWNPRG